MKVSIAIGVDSVPEFGKDEGRIVAVKPAGWKWGTEEVKRFLILEIDLGTSITTIEDAQKLTVPRFDNGALWWPDSDPENPNPPPKVLAKRRYSVPFTDLVARVQVLGKTIDLAKVKDMTVEYQPIEKITIPFATMILDKVTSTKLDATNLVKIKDVGNK
jgi:hypothetical protein